MAGVIKETALKKTRVGGKIRPDPNGLWWLLFTALVVFFQSHYVGCINVSNSPDDEDDVGGRVSLFTARSYCHLYRSRGIIEQNSSLFGSVTNDAWDFRFSLPLSAKSVD